jgi:HD-GYP domain-containing protein (c-di-GMP phosphodiesterase class II)
MAMNEQILTAFRDLISALQIARLYSTQHAKFLKFVDTATQSLQEALRDRAELVFGIVGDELAFEKEILFELSKSMKPLIQYLKSRGIERIALERPVYREELIKFITLLTLPKDQAGKDPQEYLTRAGVRNISAGRIKAAGAEGQDKESAAAAVDYLSLYNSSMDSFSKSLEGVLNDEEIDYLNLRFGVTNMLENLATRYKDLLKLTMLKRYDVTTFVHIMNVSILSMFFATKLGLSKEEVLDIGIAALFHDVGKMYISRSIVRKTGKLTDEEFAAIRGHTVFGAEIMLKYVSGLGMLPVVAAYEHHLRSDNRSYPKQTYTYRPHLSSSIIAICDVYDALASRRSYKAGLAPNIVYEIISKERDKHYIPELVDKFFSIMGIWPIGTIVQLSDGSVGVVRDENPDDINAPVVEVVFPEEKKQLFDLRSTKDSITILKHLDPATDEGKPYANLV